MLTQWLTFAVMILIQAVMAAAIVSKIQTTLGVHTDEIEKLRKFKHDWGPKEMLINHHASCIEDHEQRIRELEQHKGGKR